ncbi:hypothetical protein SS50377_20987 [Spironucleus salmonicida]|uniref:Uncharacterized protein n=1 Tax=Spironucleus salmonicida TaxID=348837 RepID=V6LSA9_9EUKA|nr:hypothetical protein SS50377_20987 [Spironucleus salmonicida]|eukprot:EST43654.1 Hypothetical protein SS50377_16697 [Spironucleus salmonicida]
MITIEEIQESISQLKVVKPDSLIQLINPKDQQHFVNLLLKNENVFWPYLIFGYQFEYPVYDFLPKNIVEQEQPAQFSQVKSPVPKFAVQVMTQQTVSSNFTGPRSEDPVYASYFTDIKNGKSRNFVQAKLKAATGKDPEFLNFPDLPADE